MSDGRDEKTQEIAVPVRAAPRSNIVHVNFSARKSSPAKTDSHESFSTRATESSTRGEKISFEPRRRRHIHTRTTDHLSPWLIRGIVLLAVLLLSLLVL